MAALHPVLAALLVFDILCRLVAIGAACFGCPRKNGGAMALTKPPQVENDEFKSAKWDELATGRRFSQSDAPTLALLCQWHKIAQLAQDELDAFGEQTAYSNDMGDLKAFPQIGTLKTASAEIRQLNKQLGICDDHEGEVGETGKQGTVLHLVQARRAQRVAGA